MSNPIIPLIFFILILIGATGSVIEDHIWYKKHEAKQERVDSLCNERGHVMDGNGLTRYWHKQQTFVVDSIGFSVKTTLPIEGSYRCERCGQTIVNYGDPITDTIWRKKR